MDNIYFTVNMKSDHELIQYKTYVLHKCSRITIAHSRAKGKVQSWTEPTQPICTQKWELPWQVSSNLPFTSHCLSSAEGPCFLVSQAVYAVIWSNLGKDIQIKEKKVLLHIIFYWRQVSLFILLLFCFSLLFTLLSYILSHLQLPLLHLPSPPHTFSLPQIHSSISLKKKAGLPVLSIKHSISSCNMTRHLLSYEG